MVEIKKNLVAENMYGIKCPYTMVPNYVIIHNTANDAPAANEVAYMRSNKNQVSFHYAVDDKEIVQGVPEERNTWNAGDGGKGEGNRKGISIEICYSKSGGERFVKAEKNAAELAASILKRYNLPISHLKKHQDFNGKYCPHRTLDMGWNRFVKMVEEFMNIHQVKAESTESKDMLDVNVGDVVSIAKNAKWYDGGTIPGWVLSRNWIVSSISGNRVVIDKDTNGEFDIDSPIDIKYLTPAKSLDKRIDGAKSYDKSKAGKYKVRAKDGLRLRAGASTSKDILETMPNGTIVTCYGYYTNDWLYVISAKGNIGFCHKDYLTKV